MRSPEQLKGWARNVAAEKHLRAQEILQMFMFERLHERLGGFAVSEKFHSQGRTSDFLNGWA